MAGSPDAPRGPGCRLKWGLRLAPRLRLPPASHGRGGGLGRHGNPAASRGRCLGAGEAGRHGNRPANRSGERRLRDLATANSSHRSLVGVAAGEGPPPSGKTGAGGDEASSFVGFDNKMAGGERAGPTVETSPALSLKRGAVGEAGAGAPELGGGGDSSGEVVSRTGPITN